MFSSQILHITTRRAIISLVLCSAPVATFIKHKHSRYNPLFPGQHLCGDASLESPCTVITPPCADEYTSTYEPEDQLEWALVLGEIKAFVESDSFLNVIDR